MTLHQLKTEAREEFDKEFTMYGHGENLDDQNPASEVKRFIDSIIDKTYHVTKEEVRGIVKKIGNHGACSSGLCGHVNLVPDSVNHGEYVGRAETADEILSALEDTTTSPDVS